MLDHARAFLSTVLPWPGPDDQPAFCNIHWKSFNAEEGKFYWGGRAYRTLNEMVRGLSWALKQPDIQDLYVCMSSQAHADEKVSKRGYRYHNAVRFQQNVVALKSLYIDVDAVYKGYPTTEDALLATQNFCTAVGLPVPTTFVASGSGGFHCHWVMDRPLGIGDWQLMANALARAAREHGLQCDSQCTIDAARILRIPETFNRKTEEPKPVTLMSMGQTYTVEELWETLSPYMGEQEIAAANMVASGKVVTRTGNDELGAGIGEARPQNIDMVAMNCAFVAEALATGGANYSNPLWFLTTAIATFCEDGRNVAHRMASGHPGYVQEKTDALFDRLDINRQTKDLGWPKCEKIELTGYAGCATCQFRQQGKSPLNHAQPVPVAQTPQATATTGTVQAPAQPVQSDMPEGFFRGPDGRVYAHTVDESGKPLSILIFPWPMLDAWIQDNPWILHFTTVIHSGIKQKVELPLAEIAPKDGILKVLGRQGMVLGGKSGAIVREFVVAWIQKLQNERDKVVSSSPFGWARGPNGKIEGFTYGGKVWCPTLDRPASAVDGVLYHQYTPKGELQPWIDAAAIITSRKMPGLDAIIAAAFGSPLVAFTGQRGAQLNVYSTESGVGKTTTMRIAQAVWGDPVKGLQGLTDTNNSVFGKMGKLKVLPLFWDELKTEADTRKFVNMAFQLTGGVEKARMQADATLRDRGEWQTLLVSCSNDSLMDAAAREVKSTVAGVYRLFEYTVPKGSDTGRTPGDVDRAVAVLNQNYGMAGLAYAQFIGRNHERIEREVSALHNKIYEHLKMNQEERVWLTSTTACIAGALYANELGLTKIDVPALKDHLFGVIKKMRELVTESPSDMKNQVSVSTILAQYLNAMRARHTIVTNRLHVGVGKPTKGTIKVLNDLSKLEAVYVHIGRDDRLMRISSTHFSHWLHEHDFPNHALRKALREEFGMRLMNSRLGSGTPLVCATEYVLELDMNDLKLQQFLEVE